MHRRPQRPNFCDMGERRHPYLFGDQTTRGLGSTNASSPLVPPSPRRNNTPVGEARFCGIPSLSLFKLKATLPPPTEPRHRNAQWALREASSLPSSLADGLLKLVKHLSTLAYTLRAPRLSSVALWCLNAPSAMALPTVGDPRIL